MLPIISLNRTIKYFTLTFYFNYNTNLIIRCKTNKKLNNAREAINMYNAVFVQDVSPKPFKPSSSFT